MLYNKATHTVGTSADNSTTLTAATELNTATTAGTTEMLVTKPKVVIVEGSATIIKSVTTTFVYTSSADTLF